MFCSFLSNYSKQDAANTDSHSKHLLQLLQHQNILHTIISTIWDTTDGCADQYICATVLYLFSMLSHAHYIIIYRGVGSPVHGKDVLYGLNATYKSYL